VLCEKPMAIDAFEAAQMVAASEQHPDSVAWIDHELRYEPNRRRARELIRSDAIGELRHIELSLKPYLRATAGRRPQMLRGIGGSTPRVEAASSAPSDHTSSICADLERERNHVRSRAWSRPRQGKEGRQRGRAGGDRRRLRQLCARDSARRCRHDHAQCGRTSWPRPISARSRAATERCCSAAKTQLELGNPGGGLR